MIFRFASWYSCSRFAGSDSASASVEQVVDLRVLEAVPVTGLLEEGPDEVVGVCEVGDPADQVQVAGVAFVDPCHVVGLPGSGLRA